MADTGGVPPGEVGGWIAIAAGALALFGGPKAFAKAVAWLDARAERRRLSREQKIDAWQGEVAAKERALAAREAELDGKIAANLAKCEAHCAQVTARADKLFYVVVLIFPEVRRLAPESALLQRASGLLADILPVPLDLPEDMQAQLDLLDRKTS